MPDSVKILVIDDEDIVLQGVKRILRSSEEYRIDTAGSGAQGIELAQAHCYNVIFTDLVMPGMDGMEVLRRLVQEGNQAKIVMFTGYATMQTAFKALRMGACDFLAKPFTAQELRGILHKIAHGPKSADRGNTAIWTETEGNSITIGLERQFLDQIGKIGSIDLIQETVAIKAGEEFCKIVDEHGTMHLLRSPVSGTVAKLNGDVLQNFPLLYDSPRSRGWLVKITIAVT